MNSIDELSKVWLLSCCDDPANRLHIVCNVLLTVVKLLAALVNRESTLEMQLLLALNSIKA